MAGRVPVVIGTGAISTSEAVRLSLHAQEIGADAVLVVPVTYWIPTEAELFGHYEAIAQAVKIPLCVYTALELLGRPAGPPRRPIRMLDGADRERLRELLLELELPVLHEHRDPHRSRGGAG